MCKFTVACYRSYKQDDEFQKEVSYFDVTTWTLLGSRQSGGSRIREPLFTSTSNLLLGLSLGLEGLLAVRILVGGPIGLLAVLGVHT